MPGRDIVVVGASAGGVEALTQLVRALPADLPAALFVVCHIPPAVPSRLPQILSRQGPLPAAHPRDGEPIRPGRIYVAPPDYHLRLTPGLVRLGHGPRDNRHRPAIDPLFRSAARAYGPRVVGVVLSGTLSDGSAGLLAVRNAGGVAVVQDPEEAEMSFMPRSAQEIAGADYVLPASQIAALLADLAGRPFPPRGGPNMADPLEQLPEQVRQDMLAQQNGRRRGQLTVLTCPECGGSLWQVDEEKLTRFRCHTGHAYYGEALLAEQSEVLEAALWTAVRTFKEQTILARQLAATERERGNAVAAGHFEESARLAEHYSELIIRNLLWANGPPGGKVADTQVPPAEEAAE
jgi:two-component system chemotaxis response regulator CheB